ncbi:MAG: SIMPL domain-containing protein [Pseudomonadota bacterium]
MSGLWVIFAGFLVVASGAAAQEAERHITVTGEGVVDARPDMATIRMGVTTEAKGAREAIDDNSRAMAGVLSRLEGLGLEERDLQTAEFSVQPKWGKSSYSSGAAEIDGFIVRNILIVRVRDLERLGEVLDAVTRDGANSFDGLRFGLQNPGPSDDEARRLAAMDGKRKAQLYAEAAGVALGPLVRIDEQGGRGPGPVMMAEARMAVSEAVPVAAGEVSVSARVLMIYEIAP